MLRLEAENKSLKKKIKELEQKLANETISNAAIDTQKRVRKSSVVEKSRIEIPRFLVSLRAQPDILANGVLCKVVYAAYIQWCKSQSIQVSEVAPLLTFSKMLAAETEWIGKYQYFVQRQNCQRNRWTQEASDVRVNV